MLNTDVDGFRITDEKGLRLFAFTTNGLRILQFANVPPDIGNVLPSSGT